MRESLSTDVTKYNYYCSVLYYCSTVHIHLSFFCWRGFSFSE